VETYKQMMERKRRQAERKKVYGKQSTAINNAVNSVKKGK